MNYNLAGIISSVMEISAFRDKNATDNLAGFEPWKIPPRRTEMPQNTESITNYMHNLRLRLQIQLILHVLAKHYEHKEKHIVSNETNKNTGDYAPKPENPKFIPYESGVSKEYQNLSPYKATNSQIMANVIFVTEPHVYYGSQ